LSAWAERPGDDFGQTAKAAKSAKAASGILVEVAAGACRIGGVIKTADSGVADQNDRLSDWLGYGQGPTALFVPILSIRKDEDGRGEALGLRHCVLKKCSSNSSTSEVDVDVKGIDEERCWLGRSSLESAEAQDTERFVAFRSEERRRAIPGINEPFSRHA